MLARLLWIANLIHNAAGRDTKRGQILHGWIKSLDRADPTNTGETEKKKDLIIERAEKGRSLYKCEGTISKRESHSNHIEGIIRGIWGLHCENGFVVMTETYLAVICSAISTR